jgi:hypothetical protein
MGQLQRGRRIGSGHIAAKPRQFLAFESAVTRRDCDFGVPRFSDASTVSIERIEQTSGSVEQTQRESV